MNKLLYGILILVGALTLSTASAGLSVPILAGQHEVAGEVTVDIIDEQLVIKYSSNDEWTIKEYHLHVSQDVEGIPSAPNGNPKIGLF